MFFPLYTFGKLDDQSENLLYQIAEGNEPPLASLTPIQARKSFLEKSWLGEPYKEIYIKNRIIVDNKHSFTIRIYTPQGKDPFPILLFFHGGGFVLGSLDDFDPFCTFLAKGASCIVVSVGYRLAPEHKFPAAVEDTKSALKWIGENAEQIQGDPSRIAVAGDSAGGNLAAVAAIIGRDEKSLSIVCQVLICPWLDLSATETDSYKYFGEGLWLSRSSINWYRNYYLNNKEQAFSFLASPLLSTNLSGLPSALIITAEFDVLRDEGEKYAGYLKANGIPVHYKCYNGVLHDFVLLPGVFDKARLAINEICTTLKKIFYE